MKEIKPVLVNILPNINGETDNVKLYVTTNEDYYNLVHYHSFFEFTFIERGEIINSANNEKVTLSKNDIMILRPECVHQIVQIPNKNYLYFNLEVNVGFLTNLLKQLNIDDVDKLIKNDITYIHGSESDSYELIRLVNLSQKISNTPEEKQFYLTLIVTKLLIKFVTNKDTNKNASRIDNSTIINKVLTTLNNPDKFCFNLSELCNELGYSQEYIIRLFKKAKLKSPSKIFLKNKMIYASTLLTTSNIKVIDIAELCGIYTAYYFYKSFKSEFGISPTEYRKRNQIFVL